MSSWEICCLSQPADARLFAEHSQQIAERLMKLCMNAHLCDPSQLAVLTSCQAVATSVLANVLQVHGYRKSALATYLQELICGKDSAV